MSACKKDNTTAKEDLINFETDAKDINITNADNFIYVVTLTSLMPTGGIEILEEAKEEISGNSIPQIGVIKTGSKQTVMRINNLPNQKWVIISLKVCSANNPLNCKVIQFKLIYK